MSGVALRVVHVGLDPAGRTWAGRVRARRDLRSVAVVDAAPRALAWARAEGGVPGEACHATLDPALHAGADVAFVAGPVATRDRVATAALDAGLHVLVEPPLALRVADAAGVLEVARRRRRTVTIALPDRLATWHASIRRLVRAGRIGEITHMSVVDGRAQNVDAGDDRTSPYVQLHQRGVHDLDAVRDLAGLAPASAMARATAAPWSRYEHGSTTELVAELQGGLRVHYHGSLTANHTGYALWIDGAAGVLWTDRRRIWWRPRGLPRFVPWPAGWWRPGDGTSAVLDRVVAAATTGREAEVNLSDHLWTVALLEAAMQSDATGRVASVLHSTTAAGSPPTGHNGTGQ